MSFKDGLLLVEGGCLRIRVKPEPALLMIA